MATKLLGLRTLIFPAPELEKTKKWWASALGFEPYFDEPFYVGFSVGGFELGLDPNADPSLGQQTYFGVEDIETTFESIKNDGAAVVSEVEEVGSGIKVALLRDPMGNLFGLIENPHFKAE